MPVLGVIPAAGRGSRFAAASPGAPPKLLTLIDHEPMIRRAVTSLIDGGADRAVVVASMSSESGVRSALSGLPVAVVVNPDPERGMFSSIQCGVANALPDDLCVLLPGDMPYVRPETVALLLSAARRSRLTVVPVYEGRRGHPLVLSAGLRDQILRASADAILSEERQRDTSIAISVNDPGVHRDVDHPGDVIIGA